jgi:protein SPT2
MADLKLTYGGAQFASLMAAASEGDAERRKKLARLQAAQQHHAARTRETDLAAKDREKAERWEKVIESHEKTVKEAEKKPVETDKKPVLPSKPKVLQPVKKPREKKAKGWQPKSNTFKKLLKQAAKVDSSSFRLAPKLKMPAKVPVAPRPPVQPAPSNPNLPRTSLPAKPPSSAPHISSKPRALASPRRSLSPVKNVNRSSSPLVKAPKPAIPATSSSNGGKDAKSRLRESFKPNQLIPLATGPRRDVRTIEEAQADLWKKKGKTFPSAPKEGSRVPASARAPVLPKKEPTPMGKVSGVPTKKPAVQTKPKKRAREEEDDSDRDSFIAYSDEEDRKSDTIDFRAEIRAMFSRNRTSRVVDEEDDSDMEATGFEMEREEARAARLARMEDEAEERRLEEHAREKKKRKLDTGKKRV